jgi:hypothetical protein
MLFIKPGIWAFSARCKNVPYSVSYPLSIHSHSTDWRRVLLPTSVHSLQPHNRF